VAPDNQASRNQFPKWSADGKYVAYMSDKSGRDEIWISDPEGRSPKKITDLDNEKGAVVWTPDSKSLLYTAADKKLYSYSVADAWDRDVERREPIASRPCRRTASGWRSRQIDAAPHVHRAEAAARSVLSRRIACPGPAGR
jgi:Tol biopolymer transport system component